MRGVFPRSFKMTKVMHVDSTCVCVYIYIYILFFVHMFLTWRC